MTQSANQHLMATRQELWTIRGLVLLLLWVSLAAAGTVIGILMTAMAAAISYPYRNALGWRWVLLPIAFALLYLVGIVIHATLDLPAGGAMDVSP